MHTPSPANPDGGAPRAAPHTMANITLELTVDEINLVLEAVGQLPFARVFQLVGKIQSQAAAQLQVEADTPPKPAPGVAPVRAA